MLYDEAHLEYQTNHYRRQQNCVVLIIFFLSLPSSISGKGECNINKRGRSNTFFFLLYLEECIFKGSSMKENKWPRMYTVIVKGWRSPVSSFYKGSREESDTDFLFSCWRNFFQQSSRFSLMPLFKELWKTYTVARHSLSSHLQATEHNKWLCLKFV